MRSRQFDVFLVAGSVFALVGSVLLTAGALIGINMAAILASPDAYVEGDPDVLVWSMCGMGALCLAIGLALLIAWLRHKKHEQYLVRRGIYTWGELVDVQYDWSVTINGAPGVDLVFREAGIENGALFSAGPFRETPELLALDSIRVKIYLGEDQSDYYVDMSTAL